MPAAIALPIQHTTPRPLSPTDISQFIRLDQCERYLRLHERIHGAHLLRDYDVTPQSFSLSPVRVLTLSGWWSRPSRNISLWSTSPSSALRWASEVPQVAVPTNGTIL
jgi:hypothetical protein